MRDDAVWLEFWAKVRAATALLALCAALLIPLGLVAALLFAAVVP